MGASPLRSAAQFLLEISLGYVEQIQASARFCRVDGRCGGRVLSTAANKRSRASGVALLTGIGVYRLAGLLSAEAIPSTDETDRLTAVLIEGRDLGACRPCRRAPARFLGEATNGSGEWGERITRSGLTLARIAAETGLKSRRARRIRDGSPPTTSSGSGSKRCSAAVRIRPPSRADLRTSPGPATWLSAAPERLRSRRPYRSITYHA